MYFVDAGADPKRPRYYRKTNQTEAYRNKHSIGNSDTYPQKVFQSYRSGSVVTYTFPDLKPQSINHVKLGFAEIYKPHCKKGMGARVFDVAVNGSPFLTHMDVLAKVSCYTAYVVDDFFSADKKGKIEIVLTSKRGDAFVSMIEIETVEVNVAKV
jgi:Malectin domain